MNGQQDERPQTQQAEQPPVLKVVDVPNAAPTDHSIAMANAEASGIANGDLERQSARNDHGRKERLRTVFHCCSIAFLILVTAIAAVAVCSLAWQYLTPADWPYRLSATQVDKLQTIMASALTSTLFVSFGKKIFDKL